MWKVRVWSVSNLSSSPENSLNTQVVAPRNRPPWVQCVVAIPNADCQPSLLQVEIPEFTLAVPSAINSASLLETHHEVIVGPCFDLVGNHTLLRCGHSWIHPCGTRPFSTHCQEGSLRRTSQLWPHPLQQLTQGFHKLQEEYTDQVDFIDIPITFRGQDDSLYGFTMSLNDWVRARQSRRSSSALASSMIIKCF